MNDLADRKRLLLAEADLHRQLVRLEWARLHRGTDAVRAFTSGNRWWLLGLAVAGGTLLARRWHGLARWLPTVIAVVRAFR